jgi:hypothetical protein
MISATGVASLSLQRSLTKLEWINVYQVRNTKLYVAP